MGVITAHAALKLGHGDRTSAQNCFPFTGAAAGMHKIGKEVRAHEGTRMKTDGVSSPLQVLNAQGYIIVIGMLCFSTECGCCFYLQLIVRSGCFLLLLIFLS